MRNTMNIMDVRQSTENLQSIFHFLVNVPKWCNPSKYYNKQLQWFSSPSITAPSQKTKKAALQMPEELVETVITKGQKIVQ